jgi:hypothetical protein
MVDGAGALHWNGDAVSRTEAETRTDASRAGLRKVGFASESERP